MCDACVADVTAGIDGGKEGKTFLDFLRGLSEPAETPEEHFQRTKGDDLDKAVDMARGIREEMPDAHEAQCAFEMARRLHWNLDAKSLSTLVATMAFAVLATRSEPNEDEVPATETDSQAPATESQTASPSPYV